MKGSEGVNSFFWVKLTRSLVLVVLFGVPSVIVLTAILNNQKVLINDNTDNTDSNLINRLPVQHTCGILSNCLSQTDGDDWD